MKFIELLRARTAEADSMLCVGLDPLPKKMPKMFPQSEKGVFAFLSAIVEASAEFACCYKPQIAHFSAHGWETMLAQLIRHIHVTAPGIPVLLDAKRSDIGSTAEQYAIEAFTRYNADAVTVNPYLGTDSIEPFSAHKDKGVFVLCRTSNPSADDFQSSVENEPPLYERVARMAASTWNKNENIGLVVGATAPQALANVRRIVGDMPILVPGIGAQGGQIADVIANGLASAKDNLLINASRSILYAGGAEDFADKARMAARQLRDEIREHIQTKGE